MPFGFVFDPAGRVVAAEAGANALTTSTRGMDGSLSGAQSRSDGQAARCWVASVAGSYSTANAGSNSISGYSIDANGTATLLLTSGPTAGVVASTELGAIDLGGSSDGRFLYAASGGAGTVDEFTVNPNGTLTKLGVITLSPGLEGIAAS